MPVGEGEGLSPEISRQGWMFICSEVIPFKFHLKKHNLQNPDVWGFICVKNKSLSVQLETRLPFEAQIRAGLGGKATVCVEEHSHHSL